ncbi:MAG: Glu/Leu/Phe/Val dehydrogenase dimerization domain-containing protein, partial [Planctomycetia bacterium]|nr:Glu/Leu/Phe/Val dehydrogenase dimerization domain-containing protein [Planctomycetia bacterium]
MSELVRYIGPDVDVPAGDIGTGAREIGYMFGQYRKMTGRFAGVLTGKGLEWGGSLIRPEATGYGCVYFAKEMLAARGEGFEGRTACVSGSGNVAQFTVEKLNQFGAKVLTMSDSNGTIYDPSGITQEKLEWVMELKNVRRGRIREYADHFAGSQYLEGQRPWGVKCDLAFPSATQNEISAQDAQSLVDHGCILVAEGANMPTVPAGIEIFQKAGLSYAPGKASNAGGVATSGLEMCQNYGVMKWTAEEVDRKLHDIMVSIHENCVKYGRQADGTIDYVKGANIAGFVKVANAMLAQGVI